MSNIDVRDDQDLAAHPQPETAAPIQVLEVSATVQQKLEELVFEMT